MKLKRIKKLRVNNSIFDVVWDSKYHGAGFDYSKLSLTISTDVSDSVMFMYLCHELWEVCAIEMGVRLNRPDCLTDYIFVYDHRQHTTMCEMFTGFITQFIK